MQKLVDLPLFDYRIGTYANAGIHKQFTDIFQPAVAVVDLIETFPALIKTTGNNELVVLEPHVGDGTEVKIDL